MTNLALQGALPKLSSSNRRLVLLAPALDQIDRRLTEGSSNTDRYDSLLAKLQRFRGNTYLQDGALRPYELKSDGRHCVDADYSGWHVVAVDAQGEVCGCSRYRIYSSDVQFSDLAVGRSALARSAWRSELIEAVQRERELARQKRVNFVEVGGWAIAAELRRTTEALRIALATYALADYLGGCVGLTTATRRHHSASVLKKIGGSPLVSGETELPPYFDPEYECEMEILKFDSDAPSPKFKPWIEQLRVQLASIEVVAPELPKQPKAARQCIGGVTRIRGNGVGQPYRRFGSVSRPVSRAF
jgi:hypothetical protein